MSDTPERVWVKESHDSWGQYGHWYAHGKGGGTEYVRANRIEELKGKLAKAVGATEVLNAACDAMWNDHERLEENPSRFGQPYRLKENHMRAISEAQQKLPVILTELKGQDNE